MVKSNELYWKIKYLNKVNPERYHLDKYVKDISKLNNQMNQYYDHRINELTLTYQMATNGLTQLPPLYDKANAIESLLYWNTAAKNNTTVSYDYLDQYINSWDEKFSDKEGIHKYLEENKTLINSENALTSYAQQ